MKILIVVDMQNDFIDGSLGTAEAVQIVPRVAEKILNFEGAVFATRDTHSADYLNTAEGRKLPIVHCAEGSDGWQIQKDIAALIHTSPFDKPSFGSLQLMEYLINLNQRTPIDEVQLVGLCTDICVISNALLLKAALPEVKITVDSSCCAGVTPGSHANALMAMDMCQIDVI